MFDVEIQEGAPRMKLPYNLTGMFNTLFIYLFIYFASYLSECETIQIRKR